MAENLGVIRLSLEANQLCVDVIETLGGLGQKFPQQLVHERLVPPANGPATPLRPRRTPPQKRRESVGKGFNFGCGIGESGRVSSTGGYDDRVPVEPSRDSEAAV